MPLARRFLERGRRMKRMVVVMSLVAAGVSSPAYALYPYVTKRPISELQCNVGRGQSNYSFVGHWGALVDVKSKAILINPKTGKPWPTYKVSLISVGAQCTLPNGGISQVVNCGGAAECSILVTCPLRATGTTLHVVGEGIASSSQPVPGGRRPAGCN